MHDRNIDETTPLLSQSLSTKDAPKIIILRKLLTWLDSTPCRFMGFFSTTSKKVSFDEIEQELETFNLTWDNLFFPLSEKAPPLLASYLSAPNSTEKIYTIFKTVSDAAANNTLDMATKEKLKQVICHQIETHQYETTKQSFKELRDSYQRTQNDSDSDLESNGSTDSEEVSDTESIHSQSPLLGEAINNEARNSTSNRLSPSYLLVVGLTTTMSGTLGRYILFSVLHHTQLPTMLTLILAGVGGSIAAAGAYHIAKPCLQQCLSKPTQPGYMNIDSQRSFNV